jgi:hypothetical protein
MMALSPRREQLRIALATLSHFGIGGRRTVPNRHDKPFANNQVRLAVLDYPTLQLRSSQNDKQRVVIDIKFRTLLRLICVLDHQLIETELHFEAAEQGLTRLV